MDIIDNNNKTLAYYGICQFTVHSEPVMFYSRVCTIKLFYTISLLTSAFVPATHFLPNLVIASQATPLEPFIRLGLKSWGHIHNTSFSS